MNTNTSVTITNAIDHDRQCTLILPFTESEWQNALMEIGAAETEKDLFDLVMDGEPVIGYDLADIQSDLDELTSYDDVQLLNDAVEQIESFTDYEDSFLEALLEDNQPIDKAIKVVGDRDGEFYKDMTLAEVAEEFASEGFFSSEYLLKYVDWDAVGEDLSQDYTQTEKGVFRI